jgi:hypothetical protein
MADVELPICNEGETAGKLLKSHPPFVLLSLEIWVVDICSVNEEVVRYGH